MLVATILRNEQNLCFPNSCDLCQEAIPTIESHWLDRRNLLFPAFVLPRSRSKMNQNKLVGPFHPSHSHCCFSAAAEQLQLLHLAGEAKRGAGHVPGFPPAFTAMFSDDGSHHFWWFAAAGLFCVLAFRKGLSRQSTPLRTSIAGSSPTLMRTPPGRRTTRNSTRHQMESNSSRKKVEGQRPLRSRQSPVKVRPLLDDSADAAISTPIHHERYIYDKPSIFIHSYKLFSYCFAVPFLGAIDFPDNDFPAYLQQPRLEYGGTSISILWICCESSKSRL